MPDIQRVVFSFVENEEERGSQFLANGAVASQFVHPVVFGYDPNVSALPYDLPLARRLLAAAGFAKGFSVDLAHGSIPPAYVAELADDLGRLGVRARAIQYSLNELLQRAQRKVLDALPILPLTVRSEFVGLSARVDVPVRYDGWLCVAGFRWRR